MRRSLIIAFIVAVVSAPAAAQDRPFLLSITTAPPAKRAVRIDYDVGIGERAFQSDIDNRPEQRVGVQASFQRLTLLARLGLAEVGSSYQSSQSAELLYSLLGGRSSMALAAGGGVLHEAGGTNVLVARLAAGHRAAAWQMQGNLLLQKPLSSERDAVDLITSVGWARSLTRSLSLGVEAIGEDLEGFWDSEEAEGGARLLLGPSLRIAPPNRRWQLLATGGPLFHPSDTGRSSDAFRDLPPDRSRSSYAFKASVSIDLSANR